MRKIIGVFLVLVLLITQMGVIGFASETLEVDSDGYYLINDAEDLYVFRDLVNSGEYDVNAKLTADIVLNEGVLDENGDLNEGTFTQWHPIGDRNEYMDPTGSEGGRANDNNTFQGIFDGQNHTIYGLYYYVTGNDRDDTGIGLFGTLDGGTVKNVIIKDSYFETCYTSAFICAYSENGTIENCDVYATIVGKYESIGICSSAEVGFTTISECNFYGKINATVKIAGICGIMYGGKIEYCNNYGDIFASGIAAGIVVSLGNNSVSEALIKGCVNYGNVESLGGPSYTNVAGVCSLVENATVEDCLNVGTVKGVSDESYVNVGGICVRSYGNVEINNCFSYGMLSSSSPDERSITGAITAGAKKTATMDTYLSNNYYLAGVADVGVAQYGTSYSFEVIDSVVGVAEEITETQAKNGTVLNLLNNEREGGPWEQNTRKDAYPYPVKRTEYIFPIDETTTIDHEYGIIYTYRQGLTDVLEVIGYNEDTNGDYVTVMSAPSFMNDQKLQLFGTASYAYVYVNGPRTMRYRLVVYGDINDDSYVNVLDAFDVERTANGYRELVEYEFLAADTNDDGSITVEDYQSVVNIGLAS